MTPTISLGDVLLGRTPREKLQQGWSPQCLKTPAGERVWAVLKTTAIQPGAFLEHENKELPAALEPRPHFEVKPGDVLLTCAGPRSRCGVPALVRTTRPRLMFSGKMYRFQPEPDRVDPRFLELYLLSPDAQRRIDAMKTGISDSGLNLTKERFLALPIPVPPLDEQRRIVEVLEDHLSRLDAANTYLDASLPRIRSWRAATANIAVWSQGSTERSVHSLLREPMRNGHSARASTNGSGIRTLTLTAVTRGTFADDYTKLTVADPAKAAGLWLRAGDILVQRANTSQLVGTTAIYDGPDDWAIFPDLLIRLRVDESQADAGYVTAAMQSERAHRWLRARSKGLAGSMPKIDQSTIASLPIPLPPLAVQRQISAQLREVRQEGDRLTNELQRGHTRGAALRRALLHAAFTGRLNGHTSDADQIEELAAPTPRPTPAAT